MKISWGMGALLALALASGCKSSAPTTIEKTGEEYKVTANSTVLKNHIQVLERSTRLVNGLLEAQIRGQNVKAKDIQFEYRFIWLDQDGIRLDTQMSIWKPMSLHAKEIAFMNGLAPSKDATDFILAIRFAQTSERW